MTPQVRAFRDWVQLEYHLNMSESDRLMAELKVDDYSASELKALREEISEKGLETASYDLAPLRI